MICAVARLRLDDNHFVNLHITKLNVLYFTVKYKKSQQIKTVNSIQD